MPKIYFVLLLCLIRNTYAQSISPTDRQKITDTNTQSGNSSLDLPDKQTTPRHLLSLGQLAYQAYSSQNALQFALEAYHLSLKTRDTSTQKNSAELLSKIYASIKDYQKAYQYHVIFKTQSDHLINAQKTKTAFRSTFAKEQAKQILSITQQRKMLYAYWGVIGLMMVSLAVVFRNLYIKRLANKKLRQKNEMINLQNTEIVQQRDEILKKNQLLYEQRNELTQQKNMIFESIQYAQEIQQSVLPSHEVLHHAFKECFVLFRPLDIVSGDFYWIKQFDNYTFFAAADCTGHGIPGAFMSMLAISCLNEIVSPATPFDTGQILNNLRRKIKYALHQVNSEVEHKDGLDIAFCAFDKQTQELKFSGAYSPLYVLRAHDNAPNVKKLSLSPPKQLQKKYKINEQAGVTLLEIKGDRQPVGIFIREKEFTTHTIALSKGDVVYAFTDGYTDQLGGDLGKKFMTKRLKELIFTHWKKPMVLQQDVFDQSLRNWQKDSPQVDDILMIGLRF